MPNENHRSENHPTKCGYLWMVVRKAWEMGGESWLLNVWGTSVQLLGGILCIAASTGDWSIFISQSVRLQIAGYGLLVLGVINLCRCLFNAPYRLHCEQIDKYDSFAKSSNDQIASATIERDGAMKAVLEKPLQLVEARRCLDWLSSWLKKEAESRPRDLSLHKQRHCEVLSGLLMHETVRWENTEFGGDLQGRSGMFLQNKASYVDELKNKLNSTNDFNMQWKPPAWLIELGTAI